MKTAICAIIKDEHLFLKEWIDWHLSLGFDAIHLFEDEGSKSHEQICEKYSNVYLRRYEDDKELREIIAPEFGNSKQKKLYEWFYNHSSDDWVAFIDIDEFIIFEDEWNLYRFCKEFDDYPAVYLYWQIKGASGHIKRPSCGVVEAYTEDTGYIEEDTWYMKSFVNINKGLGIRSVHHANGAIRTDYTEGDAPVYKKAWLNHYFTKSWEDWCERIYRRGDLYRGNRTLAQFFEVNPSMEYLRKELIASVSEMIPNGTYWLDKKNKIIAGGNISKINKLNGFDSKELTLYKRDNFDFHKKQWVSINDEFITLPISKNGCTTVFAQADCYSDKHDISIYDCITHKHANKEIPSFFQKCYKNAINIDSSNKKRLIIFRDPKERLFSAWKNQFNNYSFDEFVTNVYNTFQKCDTNNIDQHINLQCNYYNFDDIDVFVDLNDYPKFCIEHNIPWIALNQTTYKEKPSIPPHLEKLIEDIYKEDYKLIEKIKTSNKIWIC